ncbi:MAG: PQQ-like beta-propeller repeat protein [Bacteroidales bacterium]|nr:PQQ-like beta-propeller repeat protein [Bacteroidales bacterium]MCF8457789.1 PQQ-like beta-propeller repeat protein [Bacteroidales bacterium]
MTNFKKSKIKNQRIITPRRIFALCVLFMFLWTVSPDLFSQTNWKQFRGNSRNGISNETGLLLEWPESGPQLLWAKNIGSGFPEVVVDDSKAYILAGDTVDTGYEYVEAFDANTGKEIWKTKIDSLYIEVDGWGHGPRSTPALDSENIYCLSGFGKLMALSVKTGDILWLVDLPIDFGSTQPRWGYTSSPLLIDDILILETGGKEEKAYTAFDKKSGKAIWSKGVGGSGYNSPAIATIENHVHIVFAADTMLHAYNVKGDLLWSYKMPMRYPTAMPVFIPPNKIFVSSVSKAGGFVIQVDNNKPTEVLASKTMQNNWSSSIYHDGYLYGFTRARLQCVSAETGELKWSQRGFGKGSLILVDNKLIVLSDQGKVIVVDPSHEKYKELGSFQTMTGKSWTAPSFADGILYVRNLTQMACYQLSK